MKKKRFVMLFFVAAALPMMTAFSVHPLRAQIIPENGRTLAERNIDKWRGDVAKHPSFYNLPIDIVNLERAELCRGYIEYFLYDKEIQDYANLSELDPTIIARDEFYVFPITVVGVHVGAIVV